MQKIAGEHGLPNIIRHASILKGVEADSVQSIPHAIWKVSRSAVQPLNPQQSVADNPDKFSAKFRLTVFQQQLLGFFRGSPGGISIRFLRRFEARHFAKVGVDRQLWLRRRGSSCRVMLAAEVSGEWNFLHAAMHTSLFKSLERSRLCVRESAFNATLRENPTPAASLNQQEFDAAFAHAVTNGGHLLASFRKP